MSDDLWVHCNQIIVFQKSWDIVGSENVARYFFSSLHLGNALLTQYLQECYTQKNFEVST